MSRVCQRAENIEDGTDANLAACGADVFHSRMIGGSEHEAEANLFYAMCHLPRAEIDTCAKGLQQVGAATTTGGRTIAMFCDRCACSGSEDARSGRNVKRSCGITPVPQVSIACAATFS